MWGSDRRRGEAWGSPAPGLRVWGPPRLLFVLLWGWCSAPLGDALAPGPSWAQLGSRRWPRAVMGVHLPAQLRPRGWQQPHREPGAPCDVHLGVLIRFGMGMEALWLGRHPPNQAGTGGAPSPVLHSRTGRSCTDWGCPCLPQACSGQRSWHSKTQLPARSPRGGSRLSWGLSTSLCPSEPCDRGGSALL